MFSAGVDFGMIVLVVQGGREGEVEGPHIHTIRARSFVCGCDAMFFFYVFSFWGSTSTNRREVGTRKRKKGENDR